MKAMKKVKSKRQQTNKKEKPTTATAELSSFSLAAAISEASATTTLPSPSSSQPRKIFNVSSFNSRNRTSNTSQASIATNASFATAQESVQNPLGGTITPASYFVDSSDEDTEGNNFGNDPLVVLSRTSTTESTDTTPTEISFSNNPEETMPSKKNKSKVGPVEATPVAPATTVEAVAKEPVAATKPAQSPIEEEAHFDVAQNVYGGVKDVWAWGKTVPVISNLLGITEAVAAKVLDTTVHTNLEAIDNDVAKPTLKKLDDDIVTPVILAVWKIIEPAVGKTEEMVIKPVMTEVVPRMLAPLGMFDQKKKDLDAKKKEEAEAMVDASPTPEVVPALN